MARTRYVPETEKAERRYGKDDDDFKTAGFDEGPTVSDDEAWEFQSVANFVEDKLDCDCATFTGGELQRLAKTTGIAYPLVRDELFSYGLKLAGYQAEKTFRTFGDNPHNRWLTSGCFGCSGGDQIMGFVGQKG